MKQNYEENVDKNFERALGLCSNEHSRSDLFNFLKTGNLPEKQFAALEINTIESQDEADILISNLTGCDGKIREAVAFKLSELIPQNIEYFYPYAEIFADATIDINANICRTIIEVLKDFKDNKTFSKTYTSRINKFITEALSELDNFIFRDKKYTINKQLFKLYWCLESVNIFYDYYTESQLFKILQKCSEIQEYTIREKVAVILKHNFKTENLTQLRNTLKNDLNYYVKNT